MAERYQMGRSRVTREQRRTGELERGRPADRRRRDQRHWNRARRGRKVRPASRAVRLDRDSLGAGLRPGMSRGFSYWDCRVQDSRLVILNAIDAEERGATILARTEFVEARREGRRWLATLRDSG